jgi:hypothetical protein
MKRLGTYVLRLTLDGVPLPGALVRTRIPMRAKNDFDFCLGPTDEDGTLRLTRDQLVDRAMKEKAFFIMDFLDPEFDRIGPLEVLPMSVDDVDLACEAYERFHDVFEYPPNYLENLKKYKRILGTRSGVISAEVLEGRADVVCRSIQIG